MPEIVPATAELMKRLTDKPMPRTVRALAVVENDEVLGMAGFYPQDGHLVLFGHMNEKAREEMNRAVFTTRKVQLVKFARQLMGMAAEKRLPVYAEADADIPGSEALLAFLGFKPVFERIWEWPGHR